MSQTGGLLPTAYFFIVPSVLTEKLVTHDIFEYVGLRADEGSSATLAALLDNQRAFLSYPSAKLVISRGPIDILQDASTKHAAVTAFANRRRRI